MHDIKSFEEAFKKTQQMESNIDILIPSEKGILVKLEVVIDVNGQCQRSPMGLASPENGELWIGIYEYGSAMEERWIAWKAINKYSHWENESSCVDEGVGYLTRLSIGSSCR